MKSLAGLLGLVLSGCTEPELLAKHYSGLKEKTVLLETRAQEIEKQQQGEVSLLVQKMKGEADFQEGFFCEMQKNGIVHHPEEKDYCLLENSSANRFYIRFQDKSYYQWEVSLADIKGDGTVDLIIGFNHRIEYDLFSEKETYNRRIGYIILDHDSDNNIDKFWRWEDQTDVVVFCEGLEDWLCQNARDIEIFGLPDYCHEPENFYACYDHRKYELPIDSSIRTIYPLLIMETLKAVNGSKPELPVQFIDAWEQLKINEQALLNK